VGGIKPTQAEEGHRLGPDGIPADLPGAERVIAGLSDLRAGRETVNAMLVATARSRLRAAGIDVPDIGDLDAGAAMLRLLERELRDANAAFARYNALRDLLVSACARLESDRNVAKEAHRAANDPVDRAEMRAVREDMDALAADWPQDATNTR
jgi:hypothetical protein